MGSEHRQPTSDRTPGAAERLSFGPFAFDVVSSRLFRDDVEIHLTPKAAAVLCLLLERSGELISKDEFLAIVWEGVFVREESLTQAISVIRQALGDSAQSPVFIRCRARGIGSSFRSSSGLRPPLAQARQDRGPIPVLLRPGPLINRPSRPPRQQEAAVP